MGKRAFSIEFARSLLCSEPSAEGYACGLCKSCLLFDAGSHPDILHVLPEEEGKAIRVDQVRQVTGFLDLHSHYGGNKVLLVVPAEAMNRSAANGLLKTLEEPPLNSILILVSHQPSLLPVTIRSRCQRFRFERPEVMLGEAWLGSQLAEGEVAYAPEALRTAMNLSAGAPLAALDMISSGGFELRDRLTDDLVVLSEGTGSPLALANQWAAAGCPAVLNWLILVARDVVAVQLGGAKAPVMNTDLVQKLQKIGNAVNLTQLFTLYQKLLEFRGLLASSPGLRGQDLMEALTLSWVNDVAVTRAKL